MMIVDLLVGKERVCKLIILLETKFKKIDNRTHNIFLRLLNAELLLDRLEPRCKEIDRTEKSHVLMQLEGVF